MQNNDSEAITIRVTEHEVSIDSWPRYAAFAIPLLESAGHGVELRIIVRDSHNERQYRVTKIDTDFDAIEAELIDDNIDAA